MPSRKHNPSPHEWLEAIANTAEVFAELIDLCPHCDGHGCTRCKMVHDLMQMTARVVDILAPACIWEEVPELPVLVDIGGEG